MARVSMDGDSMTVEMQGLHKAWALKSRIVVPLAHVRGATADPGMMREPKGLRAPGLHIPGGAVIGTFHRDGEATFWDVSKRARAVVIELADEAYNRIIVDVADPRGIATAINRATG